MAEIRWAFKTVMSHYYNSSSNLKSLFKVMFPDSEICKQISLSSSRHIFVHIELSCIEKCDFLVVSFDEALNEVSKKGHMHLVSRYWDENTNRVAVRYLNSAFMGHVISKDILKSLKSARNPIVIAEWDINSILISMYNLFKQSPARRADFSVINPNSKFKKKICQVR